MNEFDELYNEFFRNGKNNKEKKNEFESIDKLMGLISKLNNSSQTLGGISPEESELGPPTNTRRYEEDGVRFEECTWETEMGTIVRIATIEDVELTEDWFKKNNIPTGEQFGGGGFTHGEEKELTLEEKLVIAEKVEDYETCADLRDEIKALAEEKVAGELKNNKGIPKKDKKDEASENLDNKWFPDESEWNF